MSLVAEELWHGMRAQVHRSAALELVILPDRGGKIASIRDRSGREWLEQPAVPLRPLDKLPTRFVDGDMCGWDECAPTIAPCDVSGVQLPDHGELWRTPWFDSGEGWLTVHGPSWGYTFSRRISVSGHVAKLEYQVTAGGEAFPLLWAAHPQFRAGPGTRVDLGGQSPQLLDVLAIPPAWNQYADELCGIDSVPAGGCRKFYLDPDSLRGPVTLRHTDDSVLTMECSDNVPYLGVWFDRKAFALHDVIALEPSTGFYDECNAAVRRGQVATLAASEHVQWWVTVSIGQGGTR